MTPLDEMLFQFVQAGPADQIELEHLPSPLSGVESRPDDDEQAGDERDIALDGDAVSILGQEVLAAQDAFEPAEEEFDGPAIAICQGDQRGGHLEAIREQPQQGGLAFAIGNFYDDQPDRLLQDV